MRAVWWLLKLTVRTATRLRRALGREDAVRIHSAQWVMGASLDAEEARPRANIADWLDSQAPDVVTHMRELAGVYSRTFCGKCPAGPDCPDRRCPLCLEQLVKIIDERNGGEIGKLADIGELARTGRL